jgi:hypothetical protein
MVDVTTKIGDLGLGAGVTFRTAASVWDKTTSSG